LGIINRLGCCGSDREAAERTVVARAFVNPGASVFSLMSGSATGSRRISAKPVPMPPSHVQRTCRQHGSGTGSDFAVLLLENATGTWVKVIQCLPVRLELNSVDPNQPLFSGTSVTVRVDTGRRPAWRHPLRRP